MSSRKQIEWMFKSDKARENRLARMESLPMCSFDIVEKHAAVPRYELSAQAGEYRSCWIAVNYGQTLFDIDEYIITSVS